MYYVVAKILVSKVTNYICYMSKKNLGYLVFGKVDVDVGNSFGVTCFWKVEVDFGLWSWVLEFESWVFFLAQFILCMSLLGLETIFEIKITI
jgi:hypothetical protein